VIIELSSLSNAEHPRVVSVFLNQGRKQHTTHSWSFLGLEKDGIVPSSSIWKKARFGEDAIIGNLDTGNPFFLKLFTRVFYLLFFFFNPSRDFEREKIEMRAQVVYEILNYIKIMTFLLQ
jgi:hypothetical protein